jgi:enamine deaminase RidA (YjgF/YER057c/UK114 family)
MTKIDAHLKSLGIELPKPPVPVASYAPYMISGKLVSISGQIPIGPDGPAFLGKIGDGLSVEDGQAAARLCALNLLAQLKAACDGDLDRVVRCVKLTVFVNAAPDFVRQPEVANGASDLMVAVFGDKGRHSRSAVGAASLPRGVAVEVDGLFEIS